MKKHFVNLSRTIESYKIPFKNFHTLNTIQVLSRLFQVDLFVGQPGPSTDRSPQVNIRNLRSPSARRPPNRLGTLCKEQI